MTMKQKPTKWRKAWAVVGDKMPRKTKIWEIMHGIGDEDTFLLGITPTRKEAKELMRIEMIEGKENRIIPVLITPLPPNPRKKA